MPKARAVAALARVWRQPPLTWVGQVRYNGHFFKQFYRKVEKQLGMAQRANKKKRVSAIHAKRVRVAGLALTVGDLHDRDVISKI